MGKYPQQQDIQMQQGPSTIVNIPHEPSKNPSKFKSFFSKKQKSKIVLSEYDAAILAKVKRRAKILDTGLNLGCAKIGLDPIIGLVPVAGDAITLFMAMRLIHTAQQADIPKELTTKMLINVAIDFGAGLVPILGDIVDFLYKGNHRNAKLFEEFLYERAAQQQAEAEAEEAKRRLANPAPVATANGLNNTSRGGFFGWGSRKEEHSQQQRNHHQQQQQQQEQQQQYQSQPQMQTSYR
ncbi:hypothetical protein BGZ83_006566 [Gryganskiella cystojenkinii]|nr:hypothetical protein BGZ83_006566 [Gryganskiella cystojenkinii]